MEAIKKP